MFQSDSSFIRLADGEYKAVDSPDLLGKAKLDEYEHNYFALNISSGDPATAKHVMDVCTKLGVDLLSSGIRNGICNYFVTLMRGDPEPTLNYAQSNLFIYCDYLLLFDKLDGEDELKSFLAKLKLSESDLLTDLMINVLDSDDSHNILKKLNDTGGFALKEERDLCIKIINKSLYDSNFQLIENLLLCEGVLGKADSDLLERILIKALESRKFTPKLIQGFKRCDFDFKQKVEGLWNKAINENNYDVIDCLLDVKKMSEDELKFRFDIKFMKLLLDKGKFKLAKKILDMRCVEDSEVKPLLTEVFSNSFYCEDTVQTRDLMRFLYSAGFDTKQECMRVFRKALARTDTKTLSKNKRKLV